MEAVTEPPSRDYDLLTSVEASTAILGAMLDTQQATEDGSLGDFLVSIYREYETERDKVCAKEGVTQSADLSELGIVALGDLSLRPMIEATRIIRAQIDAVWAEYAAFDGKKVALMNNDVESLYELTDLLRLTGELVPSSTDLNILKALNINVVRAAAIKYDLANIVDDTIRSKVLSGKHGIEFSVMPEGVEVMVVDMNQMPKKLAARVKRTNETIDLLAKLITTHNGNIKRIRKMLIETGALEFAEQTFSDATVSFAQLTEEMDLDDPRIQERVLSLVEDIYKILGKDSAECQEFQLLVTAIEEKQSFAKANEDTEEDSEIKPIVTKVEIGAVDEAEVVVHECVMGGKVKQLAKMFGLDTDAMLELRNKLHSVGVEAPLIGLITASYADRLDEVLLIAEHVRKSTQMGGRNYLQEQIDQFFARLSDTSDRIRIDNVLGIPVTRSILENLQRQLQPRE